MVVYNWTSTWISKMGLPSDTSNKTGFNISPTSTFPRGLRTLGHPIVGNCAVTEASMPEAFALDSGEGVDIPIGRTVTFRAARMDDVLLRFSNPFTKANNQKNFHYSAGIFSHSRMVGTSSTPHDR